MRHLVYNITYSAVPINSSLLTITYNPRLQQHSFITTQNTQALSLRYNRVRLYIFSSTKDTITNQCYFPYVREINKFLKQFQH
jgi:hypothetical protein